MYWYLSCADENGFRGGYVVEAPNFLMACMLARTSKIGGEVFGTELDDENTPGEKYRNRRLTKEDVIAMWPDLMSLGEHEATEQKLNTEEWGNCHDRSEAT